MTPQPRVIGTALAVPFVIAFLAPRISAAALLDQIQAALAPTTFPALGQQVEHAFGLGAPLTYITPIFKTPSPAIPSRIRHPVATRSTPAPRPSTSAAQTAATATSLVAENPVSQFSQAAQDASTNALSQLASALSAGIAYIDGLFGSDIAPQPASAALPSEPTVAAQSQATSSAPKSTPRVAATLAPTTTVNRSVTASVIRRIIEEQSSLAPATPATAFVTQDQLNAGLSALGASLRQLIAQSASNPIVTGSGAPLSVEAFAPSQRIDNLSNVTISNATVSGISGLSASDIPTDIVAANYLPLSGGMLAGNLTVNGTVSGTIAASSSALTNLSATNATTTNLVATNATSTNLFSSIANFTTGIISTISGTTLSYLAASTTNISASGEAYLATASTTNLTATNATTSNLAVTGTASTSNLVASNTFTLGSVTGFLKATAGAVATSLVNLTTDVTGVLPVANGGTGWSNVAAGAIPYGNGSSALATTSAGTAGYVLSYLNGVPTWTATTTLSNISGTLAVGNGGTGSTTLSGLLKGSGTSGVLSAIGGTDYEFPLTFSAPLARSTNVISIPPATGSQNGYLASIDWTTFNNKVSSSSLSGGSGISYNSSTGVITNTIGYPFPNNATTTGLLLLASTTIGSGTQAGGLTISGGATTTGNAYFAGNVLVGTTTSLSPIISGLTVANSSWSGMQIVTTGANRDAELDFGNDAANFQAAQIFLNGSNLNTYGGANSLNIFQTASNPIALGTNSLTRMTITGAGNVGIGTTTPSDALSVVTSSASGVPLEVVNTNSSGYAEFDFGNDATNHGLAQIFVPGSGVSSFAGAGSLNLLTNAANPIAFFTNNSERMRISSTGLVAIGTTTPSTGVLSVAASNNDAIDFINKAQASNKAWTIYPNGNDLRLYEYNGGVGGSGNDRLTFRAGGNIGIGTTSPATTLSIQGNEYTTGGLGVGVLNTTAGTLQTSGLITGGTTLALSGTSGTTTLASGQGFTIGSSQFVVQQGSGNVGIGKTNPAFNFQVHTGTDHNLSINDNPTAVHLFAYNDAASGYSDLAFGISGTQLYLPSAGNVGIGVISPSAALDVLGPNTGNGASKEGQAIAHFYDSQSRPALTINGNIDGSLPNSATSTLSVHEVSGTGRSISAAGTINASGADYAEYLYQEFPGKLEKAELVCIDSDGKADECASGEVPIGAVSTKAGFVGNDLYDPAHPDNTALVGLMGQIPVRVNLDGGAIAIGDPIVVSGEAGIGAKATTTAWTVGTALEPYDGTQASGTITVLVKPQLAFSSGDLQMVGAISQIASSSSAVVSGSFAGHALDAFFNGIANWLADAGNGIQNLYAAIGNFGRIISTEDDTQKLCITDGPTDQSPVCVTKTQLAALLSQAASAGTPESVTSPSNTDLTNSANPAHANRNPSPAATVTDASDTPPVIQVNGGNPATIHVGDTYSDLGATITGPAQDLNLGIQTFVNGSPMSPIQLDTSEAATDTINYVATDQSGLTSTSTRTVVIEAALQAVNGNQASDTRAAGKDNTPPSDSTSTTTTATSP